MYNGLNYKARQIIDALAVGPLSNKYTDKAEQLFEYIDNNELH